jgi:hypothetical protein
LALKYTNQKPQPTGFSHIGWSKLLPTIYTARKTSLVSCKHNRKTKRCLAYLCFLPKSTRFSRRWTRPGVSPCFSHLRWTKPRKKKGLWGSKLALLACHTKVTRLLTNRRSTQVQT